MVRCYQTGSSGPLANLLNKSSLRGLYAITDPQLLPGRQLLLGVEQALGGGARLIQYRDKLSNSADRHANARALCILCHNHGALFIVNDDIALARSTGADGVHLGRHDAPVQNAKNQLGRDSIVGISCHASLKDALTAEKLGASYVALGRFFPSQTKPDAPQAPIQLLADARARLGIPIVAIGGINQDNGRALIDAGCDMLAVVHGLFGNNNIQQHAQAFSQLF